jgi:hypothetical protein
MNLSFFRSFVTALLIVAFIGTGCGKKGGSSSGIGIELIEATTELPAKVRLFFQVDLGEESTFRALNENDFQIFENTLPISSLESQAKVQNELGSYLYSSIILLDLSGSVLNGDALPRVKDATVNYIENVMPLPSDDDYGAKEIAIYWFDGEEDIHLLAPFTIDRNTIIDSVRAITSDISSDNSTNLNGAVIQGLFELEARISDRNQDPRLSTAGSLLVFSDGADQAGRATDDAAITAVESLTNQYSVFTIGLGNEIDERFLTRIGKQGFELAVNSFDLNQAFMDMSRTVNATAESYIVLEYCSPKRSGDHNIELRLTFDDRVGKLNTEFNASGFTGGCMIQ